MKYFKTHSEFLNEAKLSAVNEKYEVIFSDGIVQGKKFRSEKQALDFMKKEIASNKNLRDIAVYKPGMYSTTQTELVVKFWGDGSYLDNVSKRDKDLASKKLTEAKLSTVHRAAKKGSYPAVIVVVQDGKVIHQEPVSTPDVAPATFNVMQKKYPKALLHLEDKTGKRLFSESVVNERLARGLKPLLQIGTKITKKVGEDELMNLSDKFDRIDDEYAGDIASHLDMAIELMQDGEAGAATKMLKQFNKKCKEVLKGKSVGSVFEGKLTEGKLNEMDINDPILVAIRARKNDLKKKAALPKVKKISTKQYYKLMDAEIDLIDQMKDAAKDYERLDSEMNQDAGQKGDAWTDADANRYGGDLNKLQTKIEKLAKQKLAVKKQIMNYRVN